jgi:hypothetical protein
VELEVLRRTQVFDDSGFHTGYSEPIIEIQRFIYVVVQAKRFIYVVVQALKTLLIEV